MDPIIFLAVLTAIYLTALFFDYFFKSCMHYPYDAFLNGTGLEVQFLRIKWYTTAFNRGVFRLGTACKKFLIPWYSIGILVSMALLPIGIIMLFMTLFNSGSGKDGGGQQSDEKVMNPQIEILLPGVNLPLEEIGFYITTMLVSTTIHELGHALAAVVEDVPVNGFGLQLNFCMPIAFTELSSEHLNQLRWIKKLRILCGGIWHNVVLAIFCFLCFSTFGLVASPFYKLNESLVVTDVVPNSLISNTNGLHNGDVLTHINDCRISDMDSWYDCLIKTIRQKPGYCVTADFVHLNDESVPMSYDIDGLVQCCDAKNEKLVCYENVDSVNNEKPVEIIQHVCLDIRKTIESSLNYCRGICDSGFCMRPIFSNSTTILEIKGKDKLVIYVGHPRDVTKWVKVSPFVPKTSFLPPQFGDTIILFLKYNIVFSMGLALMNSLPCFGLDGYHITSTIVNSFLVHRVKQRKKREVIVLLITGMGTLIFVLSVGNVLWISFLAKLF